MPLFHYEMPEAGGGIVLDGREPAPEPVEPSEPAWTGPSQEDWQRSQEQQAAIAEFIQQQQQAQQPQYHQPQGEQLPQLDPFAEDYPQQLAAFLDSRIQQNLTPYQQWQEQQQLGEAEERALDILDDDIAQHGEFINPEKGRIVSRALANQYYPEEAARRGDGQEAAAAAIARGAADYREIEKFVGQASIERHANQLKTLSGAPNEPGSTYSQGAQELVTGDYRSGGSVANRIFGGG